jgi:hypothetical protein
MQHTCVTCIVEGLCKTVADHVRDCWNACQSFCQETHAPGLILCCSSRIPPSSLLLLERLAVSTSIPNSPAHDLYCCLIPFTACPCKFPTGHHQQCFLNLGAARTVGYLWVTECSLLVFLLLLRMSCCPWSLQASNQLGLCGHKENSRLHDHADSAGA